ncbi:MAG: C40 family peptidase [Chthonomonadales bacterium]|nr:C40 family peptidase [Chthonomonadales bacterium]
MAGLLSCIAVADETLVLEVPTSQEYASSQADRGAPERTRRQQSLPSRHAVARASTRTAQNVVGRLGVTSAAAPLYAAANTRSRMIARVEAGTYLAICGSSSGWYGALMTDRSVGWIPAHTVKMLEYEIVGMGGAPRKATPNLDNPLLSGGQRTILQTAYSFLGVPYRWGGTSPSGMDCSAFVQRCFRTVGIELPRTAREQYTRGMPVPVAQLQACDRLYFQNKSGRITHTGIYIGDGYFIHSSSSRKGVAVSRLDETLYTTMYAGARR